MSGVCFTPCPKCKPSLFASGYRTPSKEAAFHNKPSLFFYMISLFAAS